jgi:hypothetical protein
MVIKTLTGASVLIFGSCRNRRRGDYVTPEFDTTYLKNLGGFLLL